MLIQPALFTQVLFIPFFQFADTHSHEMWGKTNSQNTKASKNLFCLRNKMFGHFLQVVQPKMWSRNKILRADALPLIKGPYQCF